MSQVSEALRIKALIKDLSVAFDQLQRENDALKRKTGATVGVQRPNRPKLTNREVADIRSLHRSGGTQAELADIFDVNRSTIYRTIKGVYHA